MPSIRFKTIAMAALAAQALPVPAMAEDHGDACDLASGKIGEPIVDLPFRTIDGRIYLDAYVNGTGPHVFALDTGASGIGRADRALVDTLALPGDGQGETSDGVNSAVVDKVRLARLAVGGLERNDVSVIARDYRSRVSAEAAFDGIVGREFFADGMLVIDFPARRVSFYRDREMKPLLRDTMTYEKAFRIPVDLGGVKTIGNVDTGANITMVLPSEIFETLDASALLPAGDASLTNTSLSSYSAQIAGPVVIGSARFSDVPVRVVDKYPEVLIGAHALQDMVVLIDQRHNTLALCPGKR